jgi:hypothetical protein
MRGEVGEWGMEVHRCSNSSSDSNSGVDIGSDRDE